MGDAPAPVTIGGLFVLVDPFTGDRIEVPLAVHIVAAIRRLDEAMVRRERRRTKGHREVLFSQVGGPRREGAPEPPAIEYSIADRVPTLTEKAGSWSGPRFSFNQLLGINRAWQGPRLEDVHPLMVEQLQSDVDDPWAKVKRPPRKKRCPDCGGADLPLGSYCIGCDRSGRDGAIPMPSKTELARMPNPVLRRDWNVLAGGLGRASLMPPAPQEPVPAPAPGPAPEAKPRRELTPLDREASPGASAEEARAGNGLSAVGSFINIPRCDEIFGSSPSGSSFWWNQ